MLNREQTAEKLIKDYQYMGSWDAVADYYGLSKALVYRTALRGYEPKNSHIRLALDMCTLVPTPACPRCGEVHTLEGVCTKETPVRVIVQKPHKRARRPRLAIRLDDPASAARSILKHMKIEILDELLDRLHANVPE